MFDFTMADAVYTAIFVLLLALGLSLWAADS